MPTELYENLEAPKKAVLAAVDTGEYDVETSLEELRELARTAGYPVVGLTAKLDAMSPLKVLSRGYALAAKADGTLVRSASQVAPGDRLSITLHEGSITATVQEESK